MKHIPGFCCAVLAAVVMVLSPCFAGEQPPAVAEKQAKPAEKAPKPPAGPWYFFSGQVNNWPRLHRADNMVNAQVNETLRLVAPSFRNVRTFTDQRNEFFIWTPFLGVGRQLSPHWDVFFQAGYTSGRVRTQQTQPSIFFGLPFHDDFKIYRSSLFVGPGIAWYPWRLPELRKFKGMMDRIKSAKPYITATMSWNYFTYKAKMEAGVRPFLNEVLRITQKDHWSPMSNGIAVGLDIPLTRSLALSMNAQHTWFWYQGEDFNGPGFSFFMKKFF